ncbi:MAG: hypothetical protein KTR30_02525 [Saprospiraceae bacterium]|nr:hypothetical protein [Saprospiraceae bacterium]
MAQKNVISQARNYYMNANAHLKNFTVITAFDKHKEIGVEEEAINLLIRLTSV